MKSVLKLFVPVLTNSLFVFGSAGAAEDGLEKVRDEALSDRTPGSFSSNPGTDFALIASEEGGSAVGRITWAPGKNYRTLFSLEASAPLDGDGEETELLNLDGLSGGDSAVTASFSLSDTWKRKPAGTLKSFCIATNAALEHELAAKRKSSACSQDDDHCRDPTSCIAVRHVFDRIPRDKCTRDELRFLGKEWRAAAVQAETSAIQAGCDTLAKILAAEVPFEAASRRYLGLHTSDLCTESTLAAAIATAFASLVEPLARQQKDLTKDVKRLKLEAEAASLEFLRAQTREERIQATGRYQKKLRKLEEVEGDLAAVRGKLAKLQAGQSPLVENAGQWIRKKKLEKLAPVCHRYNYPNRDDQIVVDGDGTSCNVSKIPESIAAIENETVRREFEAQFPRYVPFNMWFLTFSAGVSNRDFRFLSEENAAAAVTFSALESAIESDTKEDTSVGIH